MNKTYLLIATGLLLAAATQTHSAADGASRENFSEAGADNISGKEMAAVKYTCPMHPQIISDTPGQCPICGMDLVPLETHDHGEDGTGGKPVVSISAGNIQKMGVRTEKVMKSTLGGGLRVTGIVMENARTRWNIFSQVEGRVVDLKYSAPGDEVKKGDLFYTLYSPELLALQNDYIAATKAGYKDLAASARKRMKLLGVDETVLSSLAKSGKAYDSVPFYIPADGILSRIDIRKGHYLTANAEIGNIQDLSRVWVEAAISEKDLGRITEGDMAKVVASGGVELEATVDYIYPAIATETRTGKARLVVDNPDYLLKPGGFATVIIRMAEAEALTVPSSAILRDSSGEHVIVSLGGGKFQARSVKAGLASGGRTEITEGLSGNEEIVVNSQFLIDSESNLREALDDLSSGGGGHAGH